MLCTRLSHRKKARHSTGQYNVVQMILGYLRAEGGVKNTVPSAWQRGLGWWRRCIMRSLTRGAAARPCSTPSWGGVLHVDTHRTHHTQPHFQIRRSAHEPIFLPCFNSVRWINMESVHIWDAWYFEPGFFCATMMMTTTMMMMTMMMILCTDCHSKIL